MKLQEAVKKETVAVAAGTGVGCILLILLFLVFYLIFPESSVKFDYRVVLGALCGGAVAVANFFFMALTVQAVVNVENREDALRMMRVSYRNRMLMRGIWIVVAIFAPVFNYAAGIIPLFIPSFVIKVRGIRMGVRTDPPPAAPQESEAGPQESEADPPPVQAQESEADLPPVPAQMPEADLQEPEADLQEPGMDPQTEESAAEPREQNARPAPE